MDSIGPIAEGGDEAQAGEEVAGSLVVSGGDGAEVFQPTEGSLDDIAQAIEVGVEREELLAIDFIGNDRRRAPCLQEETQK